MRATLRRQNKTRHFQKTVHRLSVKASDGSTCRGPYHDARRVFWIVDHGTSHSGKASVARLKQQFPRLTLVHAPVHASCLNQVEIYFSIVQRKVLTPNDFTDLNQLAECLLDLQYYWEAMAKLFEWKFTKADLAPLLAKLSAHEKAACLTGQ
jgi:hypothetical protein